MRYIQTILLSFVILVSTTRATITYQKFNDIYGYDLSDLTDDPHFPNYPDSTLELESMRVPAYIDDHYGARLVGYLQPRKSGIYYFWIKSDNDSELWLSTDEKEANEVKIASLTGWTGRQEWNKYKTQKSDGISLEAGHIYYIEALFIEGVKGDHMSVGWRKPSDGQGDHPAEIVSGVVLSPYAGAQTLFPIADAQKQYGKPTQADLKQIAFNSKDPAFIKYELTSLTTVRSAELDIYCNIDKPLTLYVHSQNSDNWSEIGNFMPEPNVYILDSVSVTRAGWHTLDVTHFIRKESAGDDTATLCITSDIRQNSSFASRESQHPPKLLVNFSQQKPKRVPIPEGRRLRDIVAENFPDGNVIIGGTTGSWAFGSFTGQIMDREFGYVTPENDFKQHNIHPDNSDTWNWEAADAWIEHIEENDQILRIHGPISPQCSEWAKTDSRTGNALLVNMIDYLSELCKRYNDISRIQYMDVVNEIVINGEWHGTKPGTENWECPWVKIGYDNDENRTPLYIKHAFEIANRYATKKKLILNHHEAPNKKKSWDLIKETVSYLRSYGLRVDGIGWQAHIDENWVNNASQGPKNLAALRDLIDWAQANRLEFHITEASAWIENESKDELERQAAAYRAILETVLEKRGGGNVGWNTWHIDDGHTWRKSEYPALFDTDYEAKPAYYAIQDVLANPPTVSAVSNSYVIIPQTFEMGQNYPNPFNCSSIIPYYLPKSTNVILDIYNVNGQKILNLVDQNQSKGVHRVEWKADNLSSGFYFYRIKTEDQHAVKKCLLIK